MLFKIGSLPIAPLFFLKVIVFVFLLVFFSRLTQRVLLTRLFHRLPISQAQKFALGRFATYLFFTGGLFIGLQSLGVNLDSLVVFGGAVSSWRRPGAAKCSFQLILLIEQPIRIGDRIEVKETFGDVVKIGARSIWIRTLSSASVHNCSPRSDDHLKTNFQEGFQKLFARRGALNYGVFEHNADAGGSLQPQ